MKRRAGLLVLLAVGLASEAHAAGFYITDIGTRGMARSGAFVAAPDSPIATHYNPAGLSLLKGFHAELSLSIVGFDSSFTRSCPCLDPMRVGADQAAMGDAELEARFDGNTARTNTPIYIPFLGLAYGFDWLDTSISLVAHGPNSGRHSWGDLPPTDSPRFIGAARAAPQRYRALDVNNLEANVGLGVSIAPFKGTVSWLEGLRLGLTVYAYGTGSDQTLILYANFASLTNGPEDERFDVPVRFSLDTTWSANAALGLSWELIDGLTIGSSFRFQRSIRGNGKIQAELPNYFVDPVDGVGGASIEGEDAIIELEVAPIWRGGVQYRMPGLFTAEVAVVWEGWSVHERILLRPQGVAFEVNGQRTDIPDLPLERNWEDSIALRVGGEIELLEPWLGIQLGYFYETSAIPGDRVDVARIDRPKHGGSLGLSTTYKGFTFALSGMYVHLVTNETRTSAVRQTGALGDEGVGSEDLVTTVGNGVLKGQYFIGSASLSFSLDAFKGS